MSPHFYNTNDELDYAVAAVEEILSEETSPHM
jgi:selenocysteine lyase/cysteine desulfurase